MRGFARIARALGKVLPPAVMLVAFALPGCSGPTAAEQVRDEALAWVRQAPTRAVDFQNEYFFSDVGRTVIWSVLPRESMREGSSGFDPVLRRGNDFTANFGGSMGPDAQWVRFTARDVARMFDGGDEMARLLARLPAAAIIISRSNDPVYLLEAMRVDDAVEASGVDRVITGSVGRAARLADDLPTDLVEALKWSPADSVPVRLVVGPGGEVVSLRVGDGPAHEYGFERAAPGLDIPDGIRLDEWLREVSPNLDLSAPAEPGSDPR